MSEAGTNDNTHESTEDEEDDTEGLVEINLTPVDQSTCISYLKSFANSVVSTFFDALSACATLHPDPQTAEEEMFGEDHQWITADNLDNLEGDDKAENGYGNVTKWRRTE